MKYLPQQRHGICIHAETAQSVKEAKYKVILDIPLILKPSKIYAFQQFTLWRNL